MAGLADSRPGGIKLITAQDVTDGTKFRGVINFDSIPVDLSFISFPDDGEQTIAIPQAQLGFTFVATAAPAGNLYGYFDYAAP